MGTEENKGGRPSVVTQEIVYKLEEAFVWGCTDAEACLYAGISRATLYNYQKDNEGFLDRKELLKKTPILAARQTVVRELVNSPDLSLKFLERKLKNEFSLRTEVTGADGGAVQVQELPAESKKISDDYVKGIKDELSRTNAEGIQIIDAE